MRCALRSREDGEYDTPPIAPAMWHSYHLGGEYAAVAMMAAINFRELSSEGQLDRRVRDEAVNTCTEVAIPTYVYSGNRSEAADGAHAAPSVTHARLTQSSDGFYMLAGVESVRARDARAGGTAINRIGHVWARRNSSNSEKR